jgi:hypothetical protein
MPFPQPLSIAQLQTQFINGWCAALDPSVAPTPAAIPTGDPIRALGFANSAAVSYLQNLISALVAFSRASTAVGTDLDSWLADFDYSRAPGSPASWTFSIPTSNGAALPAGAPVPIPAGTTIVSQPITVAPSTVPTVYTFVTTQAAQILPGSSLASLVSNGSTAIPAVSATAGSAYNNIPTATTWQLGVGIQNTGEPNFNAVVSPGSDPATDAQARAGFIAYIQSLSDGTLEAFQGAIEEATSLSYGVNFELWDYATSLAAAGSTGVLVPQGVVACVYYNPAHPSGGQYTGSPDDATADAILAAMEGVASFSIASVVYYATVYAVQSCALAVTVDSANLAAIGVAQSGVSALLSTIIQGLFASLGMGAGVPLSEIIAGILGYSATNASGATVAGIFTDCPASGLSVTIEKTGGSPVTFQAATQDVVEPVATLGGAIDVTGILTPVNFAVTATVTFK